MSTLPLMLDSKIKGDMNEYILIAEKILYPLYVHVKEEDNELHIETKTEGFINDDDRYNFWVTFDINGNFLKGISYFNGDGLEIEEVNQDEYKLKLIREIELINTSHAAIKKLIESVKRVG